MAHRNVPVNGLPTRFGGWGFFETTSHQALHGGRPGPQSFAVINFIVILFIIHIHYSCYSLQYYYL